MDLFDCRVQYPKLIALFGLKSVRMASVHNSNELRALESFLSMVEEHINVSYKSFKKFKDISELF